MARVPGRRPERQLSSRAPLLALLLLLAGPGALRAQREASAQASLEAELGVTWVRSRAVALAGGSALFRVRDDFSFGGAGYVVVHRVDLSQPGSALELALAYGGLLGEVRIRESDRIRWTARLLLGAGNAKAVVPVVGTELNSDNFGVLEPRLVASAWIARPISAKVEAGYRFVYGLEDIPRMSAEQLRGFVLTASICLGNF